MKVSEALSSNSIRLSWDSPLEPFGEITHYMVYSFSWNKSFDFLHRFHGIWFTNMISRNRRTFVAGKVCRLHYSKSNNPALLSPSFKYSLKSGAIFCFPRHLFQGRLLQMLKGKRQDGWEKKID